MITGSRDAVHKRLDNLEAEYHSIDGGLGRLEKRQDRLEIKVDGLDKKLDGVAADLSEHRRDTEAHRKGWRVREEEGGE